MGLSLSGISSVLNLIQPSRICWFEVIHRDWFIITMILAAYPNLSVMLCLHSCTNICDAAHQKYGLYGSYRSLISSIYWSMLSSPCHLSIFWLCTIRLIPNFHRHNSSLLEDLFKETLNKTKTWLTLTIIIVTTWGLVVSAKTPFRSAK